LHKFALLITCLCISFQTRAQDPQIAAINNYVNFNNECVHGMLIVHRLLENFNQEVNKFVDLESHQINFFSNKDLPENIFADPEHWFYERTPYEWYDLVSKQTMDEKWKRSLDELAVQMRKNVTDINAIRFEAAEFIADNDLNVRENQEQIYAILEKGVDLFEDFYLRQIRLRQLIKNCSIALGIETKPFEKVHDQAYEILSSLRYKNDNDWVSELSILENTVANESGRGEQREKLEMFLQGAQEFIQSASVPEEYKLYGKYYYFHNSKLLNYVNRYGNGYVNAYNESMDPSKSIKLMEVPHFYQVIYPSKWLEDIPLVSNDPVIAVLPAELKERTITVSDRVILVDSDVVELEIFDHKMIDGDIVSVNFNGDWIMEDYKLKGKPYPLKIQLNKEGKNYLLLHAVNLGQKPPNTMAMRYTFQGKTETVVLSSDLDESEVIEIRMQD